MPNGNGLVNDLARHIGQTVTIFTTSGGESGRGFTGVLALVNDRFVRLVTQIGSAPGCALGNCCDERHGHDRCRCDERHERNNYDRNNDDIGDNDFVGGEEFGNRDRDRNRFDCSGRTLGSVVDIPVDRIAAFVHNTVGSSW
jgi:hypothetical protein